MTTVFRILLGDIKKRCYIVKKIRLFINKNKKNSTFAVKF